jgi:NADH-quinone oxidoreductase subunit M
VNAPLLSCIVLAPLAGGVLIALLSERRERLARVIALASTAAAFLLTLVVLAGFRPDGGMQFVERAAWSRTLGFGYHLGVDGLGLPMLFLSTLLTLLAVGASWNVTLKPRAYFGLLLLLEVGMSGVFVALDYILFYVFWELVLVPMYFLIALWGGERREYAAIKFIIYTLAGSVLMLLSILALYFAGGGQTFDMLELAAGRYPVGLQHLIFWGFFIGFAVKVPVVPFHTWLPDAHVEAPTAISVLLAGVLLKMGGYGIIRVIIPTLPEAFSHYASFLGWLGVVSIIYGAFNAMVQTDLKKMIAYSSVSHMGFVLLGAASLTAAGLNGAVLQMFSHGCITAMLFLLVGYLYDRAHTRRISDFSGLMNRLPVYTGILCFAVLASLGLPGLSGFAAEFLVLAGAFEWSRAMAFAAVPGTLLTAAYLLWMFQRVATGALPGRFEGLADIDRRERWTLYPLMVIITAVGFYPSLFLDLVRDSVLAVLKAACSVAAG